MTGPRRHTSTGTWSEIVRSYRLCYTEIESLCDCCRLILSIYVALRKQVRGTDRGPEGERNPHVIGARAANRDTSGQASLPSMSGCPPTNPICSRARSARSHGPWGLRSHATLTKRVAVRLPERSRVGLLTVRAVGGDTAALITNSQYKSLNHLQAHLRL